MTGAWTTNTTSLDRSAGHCRLAADHGNAEGGNCQRRPFEKGSKSAARIRACLRRFGVNRHTVRRAIAALTAGRHFARRPGPRHLCGLRAAQLSDRAAHAVFGNRLRPEPGPETAGIIGSALEEADALLANQLDVPLGTMLIRLETLRVADGVPMIVGTSWFVQATVPNFVADYAESGSITEALRQAGIEDYRRKESRITSELVEARDAQQLGISLGQPVLVVESINLDTSGKPIQYTRARAAADRIQLVVNGEV